MSRQDPPPTGRPSAAFGLLVGLVLIGALGVRLALLGRQSYWIDELFSVNQSAGSFGALLRAGATEIHTPLYAVLLWGWIRIVGDLGIVGTDEAATRSLSTLFAVLAVVVTHRGLRDVRLGEHVRWALTAATAAGGTSLVYSLETRNYALLMLGAVGLTAATVRAGVAVLAGEQVPRVAFVEWLGWSLVAATAHLFGALLTVAAAAVLAFVTVLATPRTGPGSGGPERPVVRWAALAAAGCSLQVGWLLAGLARPGFAAGTTWIEAPHGQDVWDLVTTTFSSGGLSMHRDGFAWTSPLGAGVALGGTALCLFAAASRRLLRPPPPRRPGSGRRAARAAAGRTTQAPTATGETAETAAAAATILLGLGIALTAAAYVVSQWRHLWTLRNLIVVTPALTWGLICLAAAAVATEAARRAVAGAAVALLGAGLVPTAIGLAAPYKTDFRGVFGYLAEVRAQHPDAVVMLAAPEPPWGWLPAGDPADLRPVWHPLYRDVPLKPIPSSGDVLRTTKGTQIVVAYRGVLYPLKDAEAAVVVRRLGGPPACRSVPFRGIGLVRCD